MWYTEQLAQAVALLANMREHFGSVLFQWQVFMGFLSAAWQILRLYLKVGHDRFRIIPNSLFSDSVGK